MASKSRYSHLVSLSQEEEDLVNKAREIKPTSYAKLVVMAAKIIIKNQK